MPWVTANTLNKAMAEQVYMAGSVLYAEQAQHYVSIGKQFIAHESVNHSAGEYVRGKVTTNRAEGYFSQLKTSITGTHHGVSPKHLHRYLAKFDFRYSTCKMSDSDRMVRLMSQTGGKRLTYRAVKREMVA